MDRTEPRGAGLLGRAFPWELVVGLAVIVAAMGPLVRAPHSVARLTIVNPLPYTLTLEVAGDDNGDWMSLIIVPAKSTETVQHVVDQGRVWVFRAHGQGATGGEFRTTKVALQRTAWRLTVPAAVEARLRDAGAPPDPGQ